MTDTSGRGTVSRAGYAGLALVTLTMTLGACGATQSLDAAIKCDDFRRLPDGSWSTARNVSLDYSIDDIGHQTNYAAGVTIAAKDGEDARVLAALEKKCAPK